MIDIKQQKLMYPINDTRIIALCLIKNEEFYIKQVLENICDFCDTIIVADNISTDSTFGIVKEISRKEHKIELVSLKDRSQSQDLVKEYAGTSTWIFGVDGDEIYDPKGLKLLRQQIVEGQYQNNVQLYGNVLNCSFLDVEKKIAKGYLAPPCRSMTKLYNFKLIKDWSDPGNERLHGEVIYKNGFSKCNVLYLYEHYSWEESLFRCLHLCFLRRSSKDRLNINSEFFARKNIADLCHGGFRTQLKRRLYSLLRIDEQSSWKIKKYKRGDLIEKSIEGFI